MGTFFPEKSVTVSAYVSRLEKTFYLFFILCFSLSLNHGGIDNSVIHLLVHVLVRSHYFFAWFALLASIALNAALTYPLTRSLARSRACGIVRLLMCNSAQWAETE